MKSCRAPSRRIGLCTFLTAAAAVMIVASLPAATGDTVADAVLGQPTFTYNGPNFVTAAGLDNPQAIAVDHSVAPGRVFVADFDNNRVLGWKDASKLTNGGPADLVIGQPDFHASGCNNGSAPGDIQGLGADSMCGPRAVAVDGAGNLYVVDWDNNRVLEYDGPFVACKSFPCVGRPANRVFGQNGKFTVASCNNSPGLIGPGTLCNPQGVAVDHLGNVYIADTSDNRVLEYNTPLNSHSGELGAGDTIADAVFGQGHPGAFTTNGCNLGNLPGDVGGHGADSLCGPTGAAVDKSGNLYVADQTDNRVLEYNTPLTKTTVTGSGDNIADRVFGQGNPESFTSTMCGGPAGTVNPDTMCSPHQVAVDSADNLYVADSLYNRVLEFDDPLAGHGTPGKPGSAGDTTADMVFGQVGNFTTTLCASHLRGSPRPSANSLCSPPGVAVDSASNLFVADGGPGAIGGPQPLYTANNSRVLKYNTPVLSRNTTADLVLGQPDFIHGAPNRVKGQGLASPIGIAIDRSVSPNRIYVSDASNQRVLGWRDATMFANGAVADLVLGEPSFISEGCGNGKAPGDVNGIGPDSMCGPAGVAVDSHGNLYVADQVYDRVVEYDSPFAQCASFPCVGKPANRVFGQGGSFTSTNCGNGNGNVPSASTLCAPVGVAVDSKDNLYVADTGGFRVLEYNTPLNPHSGEKGAGDTIADLVLGQGDPGKFTTAICANGQSPNPAPSATRMCTVLGVAVDGSGNLYVADSLFPTAPLPGVFVNFGNSRVLLFKNPLAATGGTPGKPGHVGDVTADLVFGQGSSGTRFTTNVCANGFGRDPTPSADSICAPQGVAVDSAGNLYIADSGFFSLVFPPLLVAGNNRVLAYLNPLAPTGAMPGAPGHPGDVTADVVFGQNGSFTQTTCADGAYNLPVNPQPNALGLCIPLGVAVDPQRNLYMADSANNRVLVFDQPLASARPTPSPTRKATASRTPSAVLDLQVKTYVVRHTRLRTIFKEAAELNHFH